MKYFVSFCLAAAVVLGAATAPVFGCGGSTGGATGCAKPASTPLTTDGLAWFVRWVELLIP